jgi:hypothetical protein
MISGYPIIIQIKTLLHEAKQSPRSRRLPGKKGFELRTEDGGRADRPVDAERGSKRRRRNNHPQGEVN